MASKVQIAKLALQHVGDRYDISDITEATPEAEQVNLLYDDTRDALLRQHPRVFATKYTSPAAQKSDCAAGREDLQDRHLEPQEWIRTASLRH